MGSSTSSSSSRTRSAKDCSIEVGEEIPRKRTPRQEPNDVLQEQSENVLQEQKLALYSLSSFPSRFVGFLSVLVTTNVYEDSEEREAIRAVRLAGLEGRECARVRAEPVAMGCDSVRSRTIPFVSSSPDSFNGNGSLVDSVGAVESVASMMDGEDKSIMKVHGMVINDDEEMKMGNRFGFQTQCEDEGNGSKQDCSLKSCGHDNDNDPSSLTSKKAGNRRGRARAGKKGPSAALNPYEFYYYSGFGPSWGRRRGGNSEMRKNIIVEGKDVENNISAVTTQNNNTTSSASSSQFDNNEEFDHVNDEDYDDVDEDEENVDSGGKKRMRKPVKARSLKSLM
ncbi:hypothetical protein V6N12_059341 [Hibiscus sabdariffa]|uniref:Uncharacterized protein n=1 Tax=Hibiscus sabdariffa TaxID=183260 RepID=A0ABR2EWW4_9ROSI